MKHSFLLIIIIISQTSFAQNVFLKNDTIFANKAPYALLKKVQGKAVGYTVLALNGNVLMELHNARVAVNDKPGYVFTFLNDKKQGMVMRDVHFPVSMVNDIVKYNLVVGGASVNEQSESQFIKAHPLPNGYTDVEQLIEY